MKLSRSLVRHVLMFAFPCVAMSSFIAKASPPFQSAGDSASVLILSDRVGPVIDADEAERFHILAQVSGLRQATVVELPDSSTAILFTLGGPNQPGWDTLLYYPAPTLGMMAEKIDHYEDFVDGTYKMGTQPATLRRAGYKVPLKSVPRKPTLVQAGVVVAPMTTAAPRAARAGKGQADIGGALGKTYPSEGLYPIFVITLSARTFDPDTKGLSGTLGSGMSYGALISAGTEILFSRLFGFQLEGGAVVGDNDGWQGTVGPVFYPRLFPDSRFRPFLGGGFTTISVKGSGKGLLMEAGSKGFYITAGFEYVLGPGAGLSLFGIYSKFKEESTTFAEYSGSLIQNPDGSYSAGDPVMIPASVNLSHLAGGIRLRIYL